MTLPPHLRRRVLEQAAGEPSPARPELRRRTRAALAAGVAASLVGFAAIGGVGSLPASFLVATAGGWSALAAAATWIASGKPGSMTGRPTSHVALAAALAAPLILLQALAGLFLFPVSGADPGDPLHHAKCALFALAFAAGPLAAMLWSRRGTDAVHPRAGGAAIGAACGAWGGLLIHLRCECVSVEHLALGHAAPIALLAAVGAAAGARWLRPQAR